MSIPFDVNAVPAADVAATMPPGPLSSGGDWLDPAKFRPSTPAESVTGKHSKFDPARFRLDQSFAAGATNKTLTITTHKPDRHSWFMADPDPSHHVPNMMLDIKLDRETYLIDPSLLDELAFELTPKLIVPCITRQSNVFMWVVALPDDSGRINTWTQSALEAVEKAMHGWIRIVANMEARGYDIHEPRVKIDPPKWPELTLENMLEMAFKHYLIESLDHPRIRALRGEV
jgi:hypothetical protein